MLNSKKINFIRLKEKKRAYYRKSREAQGFNVKERNKETIYNILDYEKDFSKDKLIDTLKDIALKQSNYIQSREEKIKEKVEEYREKKKEYYRKSKEEKRVAEEKDNRE